MARRWRSRSRAVICAPVSCLSPALRCTCTEPSCSESVPLSRNREGVGCTSVDSWVSSWWRLLSVMLSEGVALPDTPFSSTSIGSAIVSGGCWAVFWCAWRCEWLCCRELLLLLRSTRMPSSCLCLVFLLWSGCWCQKFVFLWEEQRLRFAGELRACPK
jgi:hypothetical protein